MVKIVCTLMICITVIFVSVMVVATSGDTHSQEAQNAIDDHNGDNGSHYNSNHRDDDIRRAIDNHVGDYH